MDQAAVDFPAIGDPLRNARAELFLPAEKGGKMFLTGPTRRERDLRDLKPMLGAQRDECFG